MSYLFLSISSFNVLIISSIFILAFSFRVRLQKLGTTFIALLLQSMFSIFIDKLSKSALKFSLSFLIAI